MNHIHSLTYSKQNHSFNILDQIEVKITVAENPYELPLHELFTMAARINKKRSFLFVSKLIGKHIPIKPCVGGVTGALLASRYIEQVKGDPNPDRDQLRMDFLLKNHIETDVFISEKYNPIIIGFAETATALGHTFYDCFQKADYFHTTREQIDTLQPLIQFEEEHSHATSHRCYIDEQILNNEREIILVDDEITTGKTVLNIIRDIQKQFPRKEYTIVSILDWRSKECEQAFQEVEQAEGITIHCVSLLKGTIEVIGELKKVQSNEVHSPVKEDFEQQINWVSALSLVKQPYPLKNFATNQTYIQETGRFAIQAASQHEIKAWTQKLGVKLADMRQSTKTLCVGTGEFMYIPMQITKNMGEGVVYQSTTRSPIYIQNAPQYGVQYGLSFSNPEDPNIANFLYNIAPGFYDEVFIFLERKVENHLVNSMLEELKKTYIPIIHIVYFNEEVE